MKILSIETSCDETGISVLEFKKGTFRVLGNTLASQAALHSPYGGVYPTLAKREHIKNLPILFEKALKRAKVKKPNIIAVTSGPGLEPALWTGIVFAQDLAKKWKVPVVPVNHMEGHVLSVFGKDKGTFGLPKLNFPALALLVSGGHTELVLVQDWMKYKVIGETLDDAAGEAFDKVARMLDLAYPGGPEISRLAEKERTSLLLRTSSQASAEIKNLKLPRPMMYSKNYDFSFSGLKTAVLYLVKKIGKLDTKTKNAIALEFENAVVETLVYKTKKAVEKYKVKTLIVAGGVASNKHLRSEIKKNLGKDIKILFPGSGLATDNSIMIGMSGALQFVKNPKKFDNGAKIKAEGGLHL